MAINIGGVEHTLAHVSRPLSCIDVFILSALHRSLFVHGMLNPLPNEVPLTRILNENILSRKTTLAMKNCTQ